MAHDVRTRVTMKFAEILDAEDDMSSATVEKLVALIEAEAKPSANGVVSVLTQIQEGEQEGD